MSVGGKVHMVTEFSDNLLMFLLKCRNPKVCSGIGGKTRCTSTGSSPSPRSSVAAGSSVWQKRLRLMLVLLLCVLRRR